MRHERRELERLLERHHEAAYGWALTCCGREPSEAQDVLQETYLRLLGGDARFGERAEFRTFLFGVVRRVASERRRRRARRAGLLRRFRRDAPRDRTIPAAEARLVRDDGARRVREALAALSTRQREVLHLVFYEGLTVEAAAEVVGVSVGSARTHYARGKARMRDLLVDAGVA